MSPLRESWQKPDGPRGVANRTTSCPRAGFRRSGIPPVPGCCQRVVRKDSATRNPADSGVRAARCRVILARMASTEQRSSERILAERQRYVSGGVVDAATRRDARRRRTRHGRRRPHVPRLRGRDRLPEHRPSVRAGRRGDPAAGGRATCTSASWSASTSRTSTSAGCSPSSRRARAASRSRSSSTPARRRTRTR